MADRGMVKASTLWLSVVIDAALVVMFVLAGRGSHAEGFAPLAVVTTLWPFLVGLAVAWVATRAWRGPTGILWPGVGVWVITVAVGMAVRVLDDQGIALTFVIVAALVLGAFLVGWRAVWTGVARLRHRAA